MQTISITKNQFDWSLFVQNQTNEPVILKNETGLNYLLMPFSPDKWQEIFVSFYESVHQIQNMQNATKPPKNIQDFTDKWLGFMKNTPISENYKDEYYEYLKQKHQ